MFLQTGQSVPVDQLLRGITTVSANDACIALAIDTAGSLDAWLAMMNEAARDLGMDDSHFGSPNGYPDGGMTYTSARDLARLADAMIRRHPKLYAEYFGHHGLSFNGIVQENHDPVTGHVEGADGIKTGYTREAGYNFLGSAARNGRRLVMVAAAVDTGRERERLSREYLEWGFSAFDSRMLFNAGQTMAYAKVQDGSQRFVGLRPVKPVALDSLKGNPVTPQVRVIYRGPLPAPLRQGQIVAELEVTGEGIIPFRVPLAAAETVTRANAFERLFNGLEGFMS